MGMSIDDSERYLRLMLGGMKHAVRYWEDKDKEESDIEQTNVEAVKTALDTMRKYQQLQADYEARLKADTIATLEQLDLEIQEQIAFMGDGEETNGMKRTDNLIKDKINAFKQSTEPKTDIEEKIHKMKSEIADSLEFWDYSPNNNPLARDMLEIITNFWGEMNK